MPYIKLFYLTVIKLELQAIKVYNLRCTMGKYILIVKP